MGFLWQLLPGVREARNQVIIGYAWLLAGGLLFGVPVVAQGTNLREIVDAVGPIGVGVAVSVIAFLIGSFSDDFFEMVLGTRAGMAASQLSDQRTVDVLRRMEEWGVRTETERLEARIDRMNAEVLLRVGLVLPLLAISVTILVNGLTWVLLLPGALLLILAVQSVRRRRELISSIGRSDMVGKEISEAVARDLAESEREKEWQATAQREATLTPEERQLLREEQKQAQLEAARRQQQQQDERKREVNEQLKRDYAMRVRNEELIRQLHEEFLALEQVPNERLTKAQARRLLQLINFELRVESANLSGLRDLRDLLQEQRQDLQHVRDRYKERASAASKFSGPRGAAD